VTTTHMLEKFFKKKF